MSMANSSYGKKPPSDGETWTQEGKEELIEAFIAGMSFMGMMRLTGRTYAGVSNGLNKLRKEKRIGSRGRHGHTKTD